MNAGLRWPLLRKNNYNDNWNDRILPETFDVEFGSHSGCSYGVGGLDRVRSGVFGNDLLDRQTVLRTVLLYQDPIRRRQLRVSLKPVHIQNTPSVFMCLYTLQLKLNPR